jgi:hypothetical protein
VTTADMMSAVAEVALCLGEYNNRLLGIHGLVHFMTCLLSITCFLDRYCAQ